MRLKIASVALIVSLCLASIVEAQTMNQQKLDERQKSIITISAFTSNGDLANLKTALNEGLEAGLTVSEINEILVQLYAYCGFPRSLNAINTFMAVMEERQKQGIKDEPGREASPMPDNFNRDQYGAETRAKIGGRPTIPAPSGYQLFTPIIDTFLKEHLFADIFYRDNLDWQSRELATISALAVIKGAEGQLRFHMGGAMNMGLTEGQMKDFIDVISNRIDKNDGDNAAIVLEAILVPMTK